jgi:hypothetical protein
MQYTPTQATTQHFPEEPNMDNELDANNLNLDYISGSVTIIGTAPLSQSRQHGDPALEGESADDYDRRTWRSKLNTETIQNNNVVVVPAMALQRGLVAGAKFSKKQIEGHGRSTWTKSFESGVVVPTNGVLYHTAYDPAGKRRLIHPDAVGNITISANADGVRGSGKRVARRLPQIPPGWECEFEVMVLDPMIVEPIFVEMIRCTGIFVGVGQFRPQNGGNNGRFVLKHVEWADNRQFVHRRAA